MLYDDYRQRDEDVRAAADEAHDAFYRCSQCREPGGHFDGLCYGCWRIEFDRQPTALPKEV